MQKGGKSQMGNWLGNYFCMKRVHQQCRKGWVRNSVLIQSSAFIRASWPKVKLGGFQHWWSKGVGLKLIFAVYL